MTMTETAVDKETIFSDQFSEESGSPFGTDADGYMNDNRAEQGGFSFALRKGAIDSL